MHTLKHNPTVAPLSLVTLLLIIFICSACEKKQDSPSQEAPHTTTETSEKEEAQKQAPPKPSSTSEEKPHTSSVPGTMNQILVDQEIPEIEFEITSPKDGEVLESGDEVSVNFKLDKYRVDKEIGQHIHVIVDNEPYIAHYDASKPVVLKDLSPGTHVIRAFPARHYHLGIKKGDVFRTAIFHVKEKSDSFTFDPSKPYLTYSRPKGSYGAAAAKEGLLLDYYVSHIEIGDNAKVVYGVDGKEVTQNRWEPVILPPLEPGEHEITLKLVDDSGNIIKNGGFNDTKRTITIQPE